MTLHKNSKGLLDNHRIKSDQPQGLVKSELSSHLRTEPAQPGREEGSGPVWEWDGEEFCLVVPEPRPHSLAEEEVDQGQTP